MQFAKQNQMSDSFLIGALLTVVGGFLDAYTYIIRGGVFANAQTGNIVLLGINLSEKRFDRVILYALPILAFVLGVILSETVQHIFKENIKIHWRQIILGVEILILMVVAFIPQGSLNVLANILISFLCAMQVEAFRKVNGNAFATTMCTGNLRTGTELIFQFFLSKDKIIKNKSFQYFGIILFFIFGAILGTLFTYLFGVKAIFLCCLLLVAALAAMFINPS